MDGLVSSALMIRLSLQPSPASDASAFNNIRALRSRWAGLFPFRISASSRSRSSPLSRTIYFFTEISFAAMIASVARVATKANHQILSIWLKRPTSPAIVANTRPPAALTGAISGTGVTFPLGRVEGLASLVRRQPRRAVLRLDFGSHHALGTGSEPHQHELAGAQLGHPEPAQGFHMHEDVRRPLAAGQEAKSA